MALILTILPNKMDGDFIETLLGCIFCFIMLGYQGYTYCAFQLWNFSTAEMWCFIPGRHVLYKNPKSKFRKSKIYKVKIGSQQHMMFTHMFKHMYTHMFAYMFTHKCTHMFTSMFKHMLTLIFLKMCKPMFTHMFIQRSGCSFSFYWTGHQHLPPELGISDSGNG
jgi:hypothetical protein